MGNVLISITQSFLILQKSEILCLTSSVTGLSHLHIIMFGDIPRPCSSFTLCCVGFDFNSSEPCRKGIKVTCINKQFSLPTSKETCLIASRKG